MRDGLLVFVAAILAAGCTTAFWDRPGATRLSLAQDTEACYRRAVDEPWPAALPGRAPARPGVPADQPPPGLWRRTPDQAGFLTFDAQQRYERCMRQLGYRSTRPSR